MNTTRTHTISCCLLTILLACLLIPLLWVEELSRLSYLGTFPLLIKPAIETVPGVRVIDLGDGGYEDLIYLTLLIDNTWTIWLKTSSLNNLMETHDFRIEQVGPCVEYRHFPTLAEAIAFYRQSSTHEHCRTYKWYRAQ